MQIWDLWRKVWKTLTWMRRLWAVCKIAKEEMMRFLRIDHEGKQRSPTAQGGHLTTAEYYTVRNSWTWKNWLFLWIFEICQDWTSLETVLIRLISLSFYDVFWMLGDKSFGNLRTSLKFEFKSQSTCSSMTGSKNGINFGKMQRRYHQKLSIWIIVKMIKVRCWGARNCSYLFKFLFFFLFISFLMQA